MSRSLHSLPIVNLFERWHMDILGPLTPSTEGYKYILVCTEWLSCWVEAIPLHNQEAATIAKFFIERYFVDKVHPELS